MSKFQQSGLVWASSTSSINKITSLFLVFVAIVVLVMVKDNWLRHLVTVVTSESMKPNLRRGDILISTPIELSQRPNVRIGDVVLVQFDSLSTTVCHRVVRLKAFTSNDWGFMTQGDDNRHDDRWLLKTSSNWIKPDQLRGLVRMRIPYLGLPVLIIKETIYGKVILALLWTVAILL